MKQKLLILHGAMQSSAPFGKLKDILSAHFDIYIPDLPFHGKTEAEIHSFTIPTLADFVSGFIQKNGLKNCAVFGYSMGGYIALYLQKEQAVFDKIYTLASKFEWSENIAEKEAAMLDAEKIKLKIPAFASYLSSMHSSWETLAKETIGMMHDLGKNNYLQNSDVSSIKGIKRISLGDRDAMVSLKETIEMYQRLTDASLHVFPNTPHPIEKVNAEMLAKDIMEFCLKN